MKILEIKVMKGPNYWSVRRPRLIQLKLDLEEMEERPTNLVPGFRERLEKLIPSLYEHRCSEGVPGGFFHRVEEGTWMGHVIEHLALEIDPFPRKPDAVFEPPATEEETSPFAVLKGLKP